MYSAGVLPKNGAANGTFEREVPVCGEPQDVPVRFQGVLER